MTRGPRLPTSPALGFAGTLAVHGAAVLALVAASGARVRLPPTYAVHLVAAPDVARAPAPALLSDTLKGTTNSSGTPLVYDSFIPWTASL